MLEVAAAERPDEILHLGDCLPDVQCLQFAFPGLPIEVVPGNCDGWTDRESFRLLEREGVRLLLGHGHQWQVKLGVMKALTAAQCAQADVLLFGHTHQALCQKEGNLWVLNPGTIGGIGAFPSYGVVTAEGGTAICQVKWYRPSG